MTDQELNDAVAREVMGWHYFWGHITAMGRRVSATACVQMHGPRHEGLCPEVWDKRGNSLVGVPVESWQPSTTWEGMGLVVERMRELGWCWSMMSEENGVSMAFWARGKDLGRHCNIAATAPRAIALAALAAVRAKS